MFKSLLSTVLNFYSPILARTLVVALRVHESSVVAFIRWFLHTRTMRISGSISERDFPLMFVLTLIMLLQVSLGITYLYDWAQHGTAGVWAYGAAALLSYPITMAAALVVLVGIQHVVWLGAHPKATGKKIVARILEHQVRQLRRRHHVKVVAVAGSVGKTSTKLAIAQLLGQTMRVRYQAGDYNDRITVPLIFFGQSQPPIYNIFSWMRLFGENAAAIEHPYPYDVVVVELGTDGPGQMQKFAYVKPDITVLTAIAPEHMAYFGTLDAVASEELTVCEYSKKLLVNADDTPSKYLVGREFFSYSIRMHATHNYYATSRASGLDGQVLSIDLPSGEIESHIVYVGAQGATCALAASAVAHQLGMGRSDIAAGLERLTKIPGRMQVLEGMKGITIIDDTYNASPLAVKAALDVLYATRSSNRIALLGSMNELGGYSRKAHTEVGQYCDPKKLAMVITLGSDAERWLAPAAREQGCVVHSFSSPNACAAFIRKHLKPRTVLLAKGSQNGVFAEEVVKQLLARPADSAQLVRQSRAWLRKKSA